MCIVTIYLIKYAYLKIDLNADNDDFQIHVTWNSEEIESRKNSLNSLYKMTLFYGAILEIFDEISIEIPGLVF